MPDLISILMPVRNAAPFLEQCLQSITDQSDPDWELIAVDDHSTDQSHHTLVEWSQNDGRISALKNTGRGIIPALRLAYNKSRGTLITRMDADDIMAKSKLFDMRQVLHESGHGHVAVGLVKYFSEDKLQAGYMRYQEWLNRLTSAGKNYSEIYKECVVPSPCWMMHREDLDKIGAFRPDTYPEDYDLCFRMYQHQLKVLPINKTLHHWRDHSSRASRTDDHYADNRFLDLKLSYFLKLDHQALSPLVVWGAGKKGKLVTQWLQEQDRGFQWVTDNIRKVDTSIYGKKIETTDILNELEGANILLLVANPDEQSQIMQRLEEMSERGHRLFLLC